MHDLPFNGSLTNGMTEEFFNLVCGDLLGEGYSRLVYSCKLDPSVVIKVEKLYTEFCNVTEWQFWSRWGQTKGVGQWLAPCTAISSCGRFLVQKRAEKLTTVPTKLPTFITDICKENLGVYDGRIVWVDYGYIKNTKPDARLRKLYKYEIEYLK
jgi:hypothetical protein